MLNPSPVSAPASMKETAASFTVVLINPYELGRQPFALAQTAAWLKGDGFRVVCLDLSLQKLDPSALAGAGLVALYVGMHTATRIALEALPRVRELAPAAHLCCYGLYAPMNRDLLRERGVGTVLGGEYEPALLRLAQGLRQGEQPAAQTEPVISLAKVGFLTPDRSGLPDLARYARLLLPGGDEKVVGFAEGSRGCKHLCRHCPVVPVYQGRFRVVPAEVVLEDIAQQVARGAEHISFGDPDFLNGPSHALRLVRQLHARFPRITYDATIKIEHLLARADLLPELKATGCLFVTSAAESLDDTILAHLDKGHARADFERALGLCRQAGIPLAPTFVPFTPWTTLDGYLDLLRGLAELELVESVPPIQLTIRLLIPQGSWLLRLPGFRELLQGFDRKLLGYPWHHPDPRVDRLQEALQSWLAEAEGRGAARRPMFEAMWEMAHQAAGRPLPPLPGQGHGQPMPRLSEPWYCCAEPTGEQLQSF